MDRDTKPWAGQLYISHYSEVVAKLLYKKFFRKTDCTILHGQWKQVLAEQQKREIGDSNDSISRHSTSLPRVPSTIGISGSLSLPSEDPASSPPGPSSPLSRPDMAFESLTQPLYNSKASYPSQVRERMGLVASSRHGIVSPSDLEPIQCFVLFYTSSWVVPQTKSRRLNRIFGPELVPKIEAHIRDEFNGEQGPGTSFLMETGSSPCRYIVCTSVARNVNYLSDDFAYNAFRASLLCIHNHNKTHPEDQITSILCPALESITTLPPYNLVHQMATCYEYWDWHQYAKGAVLPFTHENEEDINKQIKMKAPSIARIAQDLEQYIRMGLLVQRGLVYERELQIILEWLNSTHKPGKRDKSKMYLQPDLPKHVLAQVLVDLLKRPDIPPFTLTPSQICAGITGTSLECILQLAKERNFRIYDEIKPQDITKGKQIAKGASSVVFEADWGTRKVAMKEFILGPGSGFRAEHFIQELTMITLVRHTKLVEAFGGYCDSNAAYIVTELMDFNLHQLLEDKRSRLDWPMKLRIAYDIADAMEFLHSRSIIHRDLKSVNILLNKHPNGYSVAKVCDFGLSRVIDDMNTMTRNIGTVAWIAPEIFKAERKYSEKCDVYSYGVILFELLTQLLPFKGLDSINIPLLVVKGTRPTIPDSIASAKDNMTKDFMNLMNLCWNQKPDKRPAFSAVKAKLKAMLDTLIESSPQPAVVSVPKADLSDDEDGISDTDSETIGSTGPSSQYMAEQEELSLAELKLVYKDTKNVLITEDLLLKCIRARFGKTVQAKHLVQRYVDWYKVLNEGRPIKVSEVRKTLEKQILYYVDGSLDKEGRHIIFWDMSTYNVDVITEPELMRTFVYCLERATETPESQVKGIVVVANLSNWSMARFSSRIVNSFFGTVRKYFPVIVRKILFLNAPGWFFRVLTMYQSFIAATMDVIELVTHQRLMDYVSLENLVPAAQGTFHFDMELWLKTRHALEGVEYR